MRAAKGFGTKREPPNGFVQINPVLQLFPQLRCQLCLEGWKGPHDDMPDTFLLHRAALAAILNQQERQYFFVTYITFVILGTEEIKRARGLV